MPLRFLTAGESHGPALTAILEGLPAGLPLAPDDINPDLARRQGKGDPRGRPAVGASPRMNIERDTATLLGGVMAGQTIGAPIALQIQNLDHANWKGKAVDPMTIPRPGHADLTGAVKYGYSDLRMSLERASARETAARGAIGGVTADLAGLSLEDSIRLALDSEMSCPSESASEAMRARVQNVMQAKDTLGGVFEVIALGVPPGLGSHVHWERRLSA